ncbi:MAG: undecaprenyl-diphosphate phosphatase [Chloroflexi bacterium]|nr:undecaprenyl-diphosphate phosphatase [Chloroflexota bacterium]
MVLGALHGPAELLPISSSAHLTLVPWLLRWDYLELDPEVRKSFEVALHAGTAAGVLISQREEVGGVLRGISPRLATLIGLSSMPPALFGYALERPIERRLGRPPTIAAALIAGGMAMAWADRRPQLRGTQDAGVRDALWLGLAQATALIPGVSRGGATLAAARARRFTRADSARLSRHVALPVIGGATLLKTLRIRRRGLPAGVAVPFALGAGVSFLSTMGAARIMRPRERDGPLAPYAAYRVLLAAVVLGRLSTREGTIGR